MNILLTNDDGINSVGILKLAEVLRSNGKNRVVIVAPDMNRSGISHALSMLNAPVKLSFLEEDTWICSGYPAECIIIGLKVVFSEKPDLVISGINCGANLGTDIIYSGTAAAARQASLAGIPAIALSLAGSNNFYWDMAVNWSKDHLDELLSYWREDSFVNVNIPNCPSGPEGIIAGWPAAKTYGDTLSVTANPDGSRFCFLEAGEDITRDEIGSDCDIVNKNFVSVSTVYNYPAVLRELCPGVPDYAAVAWRGSEKRVRT
jgi:5'-nucleotidase